MTNSENIVRRSDKKKPDPLSLSNAPDVASSSAPVPTDVGTRAALDNENGERSNVKDVGGSDEMAAGAPLKARLPNNSVDDSHQQVFGHKPQSSLPGNSASPSRPSIQFTRDASDNEPPSELPQSRPSSIMGDDADPTLKGKQSIFTKLKSFAASPSFASHSRSASGATIGDSKKCSWRLGNSGLRKRGVSLPRYPDRRGERYRCGC